MHVHATRSTAQREGHPLPTQSGMHQPLPRLPALAARSAAWHARSHIPLLLLAALCSTILVGTLTVGDSVRFSLKQSALRRLGAITHVYAGGDRFVDAALADGMTRQGVPCAPVILLPGVALADAPDGTARQVNRVQVIGADGRFWQLAGAAGPRSATNAVLSARLAAALHLQPGMQVSVRVRLPGFLPDDAPLASRPETSTVRGRFTVGSIASGSRLGSFSLRTEQVEPCNVFVPLDWLQSQLGRTGQANLLAASARSAHPAAAVEESLRSAWRPERGGYRFNTNAAGCVQLQHSSVFLATELIASVTSAVPSAVCSFSYLANTLSTGSGSTARRTPYSFITALSPGPDPALGAVPDGMRDDEILLNSWTAEALRAGPGDAVAVRYFRIGSAGAFTETSRTFRVRSVLPMSALAEERTLMPDFPGLTDVESCRDWDVGMPIDQALLNDPQNEEYWKKCRQTPKALITWRAGREMWGSRFGDATGLRFPATDDAMRAARSAVSPAAAAVAFAPAREAALQAVSQATDIGGLMLGLSAFLILAAALLAILVVGFSIQRRAPHLGCLVATGARPAYLFTLTALEPLAVALCGAAAGVPAGLLYARVLTSALGTTWRDAVAGADISFHAQPLTVLVSAAGAITVIAAAVAASMLHLLRQSPIRLLAADSTQNEAPTPAARWRIGALSGVLLLTAAAAVLARARPGGDSSPELGFFAGCCTLLSALQGLWCAMARVRPEQTQAAAPSFGGTVWRNLTRRRRRSMTVVAVFAAGVFLVLAVGTMQPGSGDGPPQRDSGTGGFLWYAESTLPLQELRKAGRRSRDQPSLSDLSAFHAVPFKLHDGDHAGCLNLNRAQSPRVVGAPALELDRLGAFAERDHMTPWALLLPPAAAGVLPALAGDLDTLQWGLKRRADPVHGDILPLTDERGRRVLVRLVGALPYRQTVLHGSLLISSDAFQSLYPSESGYRLFLIDQGARPVTGIERALQPLVRAGFDIETATSRLAEFHRVEAAYLRMFSALGGLGLMLGCAGLGLILLRNIAERRRELAILAALGFRDARIRQLLGLEHAALLCAGLTIGGGAALVSMIPSSQEIPWASICVLMAGMAALGAAALFATLRAATTHTRLARMLRTADD